MKLPGSEEQKEKRKKKSEQSLIVLWNIINGSISILWEFQEEKRERKMAEWIFEKYCNIFEGWKLPKFDAQYSLQIQEDH